MVLDWEQLDIGAAQRSRSSSAVHFTEREHRAAWRGAGRSELSEEGEEKEETLLGLAAWPKPKQPCRCRYPLHPRGLTQIQPYATLPFSQSMH